MKFLETALDRLIDRSFISSFDGIRNSFNRERDFWQSYSIEFAAILIEKEIFGNRSRSIDRSIVRSAVFDGIRSHFN